MSEKAKQKCIDRLGGLNRDDPEIAHADADKILLDFLREIGHGEVADVWEGAQRGIGFWYA